MFGEQTITIKLTRSMAFMLSDFASKQVEESSLQAEQVRNRGLHEIAKDWDSFAMKWYNLKNELEELGESF